MKVNVNGCTKPETKYEFSVEVNLSVELVIFARVR